MINLALSQITSHPCITQSQSDFDSRNIYAKLSNYPRLCIKCSFFLIKARMEFNKRIPIFYTESKNLPLMQCTPPIMISNKKNSAFLQTLIFVLFLIVQVYVLSQIN